MSSTKRNFFCEKLKWLWALDTRAMEMVIGMTIFSRGLMIIAMDEAMHSTTYQAFKDIFPEDVWGLICLFTGLSQMGGVLINGHWYRSPWMRCCGALISATFFAMTTTLFALQNPLASIAASVYAPLFIANLWTAINIASKT